MDGNKTNLPQRDLKKIHVNSSFKIASNKEAAF